MGLRHQSTEMTLTCVACSSLIVGSGSIFKVSFDLDVQRWPRYKFTHTIAREVTY